MTVEVPSCTPGLRVGERKGRWESSGVALPDASLTLTKAARGRGTVRVVESGDLGVREGPPRRTRPTHNPYLRSEKRNEWRGSVTRKGEGDDLG